MYFSLRQHECGNLITLHVFERLPYKKGKKLTLLDQEKQDKWLINIEKQSLVHLGKNSVLIECFEIEQVSHRQNECVVIGATFMLGGMKNNFV